MISEVAVKAVETSAKVAAETTKEVAKEAAKEVATKSIDIGKRIDVTKSALSSEANKVDITKRISVEHAGEVTKKELSEAVSDYLKDLKDKAGCPETIKDKAIDTSNQELRTPELVAKMREEFDDNKAKIRQEWEKANNREWPRYTQDVYNENGVRIRKAGDCYDAHHIQPIQLGGTNEVSNITPMNLSKHAEIHSKDGSCSKLVEKVEGAKL